MIAFDSKSGFCFRWHILTGEYPAQPGGVSDYTFHLAQALVACGDEVHIYAPPYQNPTPTLLAIHIHRLPDHFGWRSLRQLSSFLPYPSCRDILLVQYVPHAFGWKGMNLPFCLWLRFVCRYPIWTMFHEVCFGMKGFVSFKYELLGLVQRIMARLVSDSSNQRFVSIPEWSHRLNQIVKRSIPSIWLPVPSNVHANVDPDRLRLLQQLINPTGEQKIIGHFGTYSPLVTQYLTPLLSPLLTNHPDRKMLLLGRGSDRYSLELQKDYPQLAKQLITVGEMSSEEIPNYLALCDVMLQPYADGVSGRRTSLMASLALGRPIVTTVSVATEPVWLEEQLVVAAPPGDIEQIIKLVDQLLESPEESRQLGQRGKAGYRKYFSIERTIEVLRSSLITD